MDMIQQKIEELDGKVFVKLNWCVTVAYNGTMSNLLSCYLKLILVKLIEVH